jgi:hypothetical protein
VVTFGDTMASGCRSRDFRHHRSKPWREGASTHRGKSDRSDVPHCHRRRHNTTPPDTRNLQIADVAWLRNGIMPPPLLLHPFARGVKVLVLMTCPLGVRVRRAFRHDCFGGAASSAFMRGQ